MFNTVVGTRDYLAPKLYEAYVSKNLRNIQLKGSGIHFFSRHNLEKSDVFSLGLTLLQVILLLTDAQMSGLNDPALSEGGKRPAERRLQEHLARVSNKVMRQCLSGMLQFEEARRLTWREVAEIICPTSVSEIKPEMKGKAVLAKKVAFSVPIGNMKKFSNEKS
jgi:serine/threonine protein kinase